MKSKSRLGFIHQPASPDPMEIRNQAPLLLAALVIIGSLMAINQFVQKLNAGFLIIFTLFVVIISIGYYLWFRAVDLSPHGRLLKLIGDYNALKVGVYVLGHGKASQTSTYYVDLSEIAKRGQWEDLARLMAEAILKHDPDFDRVVGTLVNGLNEDYHISREGYHPAPIVAFMLDAPYTLLYEERNNSMSQSRLVQGGYFRPREKAIIVDDIISTGESIKRAVDYLREHDVDVQDAYVYVSRRHGEELQRLDEELRIKGVFLHIIVNSQELIDDLERRKLLTPQEFEVIYKDSDFSH